MNLSRLLRTTLFAALGLLLVGAFMPVQAQDIFVSNANGDDQNGDGSQANPFETIEKAEDVASAGDVIGVQADVYNEGGDKTTLAKNLTIRVLEFQGQTANNELEVPNGLEVSGGVTVSVTTGSGITSTPVLVTNNPSSQGDGNVSFVGSSTLDLSAEGLIYDGALNTSNGTVELGSQTLTLRPDGTVDMAFDNSGDIISSSAGTVGDGTVEVDDNGNGNNVNLNTSGGELPNVTVTSGGFNLSNASSSFTIFGAVTLDGGTFTGLGAELTVADGMSLSGGDYSPNSPTASNNLTVNTTSSTTNALDISSSSSTYTGGDGTEEFNGQVQVSGGTLDLGSTNTGNGNDPTFDINGAFDQDAGTVNAPGSAGDFQVAGDFTRSATVAPTFNHNDGTVTLDGGNSLTTFQPGSALRLFDFTIDKDDSDDQVDVTATPFILSDLTITQGEASLVGSANIRLQGGGAQTITVDTDGQYSSTTDGAVILENGNAGTGGNLLDGTGTFGNLTIQEDANGNTTRTGVNADINLSGTLRLDENGEVELDSDPDNGGTGSSQNITLTSTNETPGIVISENTADILASSKGDITLGADVNYNLTYEDTGTVTGDNEEFDDAKNQSINNFTHTSSNAVNVPGSLSDAVVVSGVLTVRDNRNPPGAEIGLGNNVDLQLAGDGNTHDIFGEFNTGSSASLDITGDDVTVSGSGNTDEDNRIQNIVISGTEATINGLDIIDGNLTVNSGASGTLSMFNTQDVQGTITLNDDANSLALSSAINVTSTSTPTVDVGNNATLDLQQSNLTLTAGGGGSAELQVSGSSNNEGSVTANSGVAILGDQDSDSPTVDLRSTSIPNLRVVSAGTDFVTDAEVSSLFDADDNYDVGTITLEVSGDAEFNDADSGNEAPLALNSGGGGVVQFSGGVVTSEDPDGVFFDAAVETTTSGTVTFATSDASTPTPRTFIFRNAFDQKSGDVELGINDLELQEATFATQSNAGNWSASPSGGVDAGRVILNDDNSNNTFVSADLNGNTVSIPYVEVEQSGANTDADDGYQLQNSGDELQISEELYLTGGTLDASTNSAQVTIGSGAKIIRDVGQLDQDPVFAGPTDVEYLSSVTTDEELPSTVRNLTDNGGVEIDKDVTVSNTFTAGATPDIDNATLTMGNNTTINLDGGSLDNSNGGSLSYAGNATLEYEGTTTVNAGTLDEWPQGTALSLDVNTGSNDLGLQDDRTAQNVTFSGTAGSDGDLDLASSQANNLEVKGKITQNDNGFFRNANGSSQEVSVILSGSSKQTVEINGDGELEDDDSDDVTNFEINNSNDVEITNGNLIMSNQGASISGDTELVLTAGNVITGDNYVELNHDNTSDQGFERPSGGGTVVGNVRKVVPSTGTNANGLQFPTGKDGSSIHRPMTVTFNEPQQVSTNNIRLEVNHQPANPQGSNGIDELSTTDSDGDALDVDRYPDFYWDVEATSTLSPSVEYDVELDARQAPEFEDEDIERVRIINRADGQITNRWDLNGDGPADYNNRQPASDRAIAVVRNSTGGLVNDPGQFFTFGLENNLEADPIADKDIDAGATETGPDLGTSVTDGGVFTGGTGDYSYSGTVQDEAGNDVTLGVSSSDDNVATGSVNNSDELVVNGVNGGTATLTVTMADQLGIIQTQTVDVDVNAGVVFTDGGTLDNQTVFEVGGVNNDPFTFTFEAEDQDPGESLSDATDPFELVNNPDNVSIDANTGELTFEPSFAQAQSTSPVTIEVQVTDNDGRTAETTAELDVEFDRVLGDVNGSGFEDGSGSNTDLSGIGSEDALAALEVAVGKETFDIGGLAGETVGDRFIRAADCAPLEDQSDASQGCGGDSPLQANRSDVNSGDALAILQVSSAPDGSSPNVASNRAKSAGTAEEASGTLEIQDPKVKGNTATLPVVLSSDAANVRAADLTLDLSELDAEVQSVTNSLPDGWMTAQNVSGDELKVGMIGQRAPKSGKVAEIKLNLSGESLPTLEGQYRLNGSDAQDLEVQVAPSEFELKGNYPNPVSRSTTIEYQMSEEAPVTIEVYNTLGQKVATLVDETKKAGRHEVNLDAGSNGLSSGVYIYRLSAGDFTASKRMTVVR